MVFLIYEGLKERDIPESVVRLKIRRAGEKCKLEAEEIVGVGDKDIAGG